MLQRNVHPRRCGLPKLRFDTPQHGQKDKHIHTERVRNDVHTVTQTCSKCCPPSLFISLTNDSLLPHNSAELLLYLTRKTTRAAKQICCCSCSPRKFCHYHTVGVGAPPRANSSCQHYFVLRIISSNNGWMDGAQTVGGPRSLGDGVNPRWNAAVRTVLLIVVLVVLCESQSHIPELETPLSERVRAFLDWLQDNRAFSSTIHVVK